MPEKFQETQSRVENQSNLMLFLKSQMAEGFFASGYFPLQKLVQLKTGIPLTGSISGTVGPIN